MPKKSCDKTIKSFSLKSDNAKKIERIAYENKRNNLLL